MPGQDPDPGPASPDANSTPAFARLGLRTPAGWGPLPSEQLLPPSVIPDYTVLRRIGGGAYGEVWLARNFTGSHFAIKVVHRCLFDHDRPYERELAGIRRFEPISRSHPSQVAIHHVGQNTAEGYFYYVMDLADDAGAEDRGRRTEVRGQGSDQSSVISGQKATAKGAAPTSDLRPLTSPFIADSYVAKTLKHLLRTRGRLPSAECLDIALALATALEHLHGHGLVHRDIKPSNVIFVEGVPKLADIGLVTSIDATQSFVGTEGFFPPEGPGTPQADIFSLGKLFYEMATGKDRREFPELPTDLASAEEQEALSELNAIVLKACQHDPGQRYATAAALRADLERLQRGRSIKRQRAWQRRWSRVRKVALPAALGAVAVLAIVALLKPRFSSETAALSGQTAAGPQIRTMGSPNPAALMARAVFVLPIRPAETNGAPADLCSRITDAFIDSLALLKDQGITVGPRKSGWVHQGESVLLKRVATDFGMRHALTGRAGLGQDRYELTLTLQDLETQQPRWSETFSGGTNDLIELERRALAKVVSSLGGELTPARAGQISQVLTNNLEALRYLQEAKAMYEDMGSSQLGSSQVTRLTQRALRLDPLYVDADYFDMYMLRNLAQERLPAEVWPSIAQRTDKILSQDDTHAQTLDQRSGHALAYQGDWEAFDALSDRCLQALSGTARHFYTGFYLRINGHFAEARIEQASSEDPEPTDLDSRYFMTASRWADRRYDEGIQVARRTLEMHPNAFDAYLCLAHCRVAKGDYSEGIETIRAAQAIWNRQELTALLGFAYARMGQPTKAREALQELLDQQTSRPYLQPYFVARVYAALGDKQAAWDWLEKAAADRSEYLFYPDWGGLRTDLAWDTLQDEPRYWKLCDRLGLGKDQWPRKISPPK